MDRKLLDYLPPVLREVMEIQAINGANEPEITAAWDALSLVLANQFLETADARGVSIWEKELKIIPKDTDSLEIRKARIKALWGLKTPYTLRWLGNWLTSLFGLEGHRETVTDYTLELWLDALILQDKSVSIIELMGLLHDVLPANVWLRVCVSLEMQSVLHIGGTGGICPSMGMKEDTSPPKRISTLRAGGPATVRSSLPVPESTAPPPSTTILRTGGVCTIISNLSKGE